MKLRAGSIELPPHRPGSNIQPHLGIGKGRNEDRDLFQISALENTGPLIFFRKRLAQFTGQDLGGQGLLRLDPLHRLGNHLLHVVQVGFHLQGVVDPVVALLEQLFIGHGRMVPVMGLADRLAQPMRDQGAGRDDRLHHPMVDHRADDLAHLGNGHRPGQSQHNETIGILDHRPEHFVGLAQAAAPESGLAHGGQQTIERGDLVRIERLKRLESILRPIAEFTCTHRRVYLP